MDNAGNRTSRTPQPSGTASNYSYDNIYELTGVTQGSTTTESYTYDPVGNRLTSLAGAKIIPPRARKMGSRSTVQTLCTAKGSVTQIRLGIYPSTTRRSIRHPRIQTLSFWEGLSSFVSRR